MMKHALARLLWLLIVVVAAALHLVVAAPAAAQDADSEPRLDVVAPDHLRGLADELRREFPALRQTIERLLGARVGGDVRCILARDSAELAALLQQRTGGGRVPTMPHVAGLAFPQQRLIILNVAAFRDSVIAVEALATLRHEFAHLVLGTWAADAGRQWPAWFEEGVCQFVQRSLLLPAEPLLAAREGRIETPTLAQISHEIDTRSVRAPAAYAFCDDAVRTLLGSLSPDDRARRLAAIGAAFARTRGDFDIAFASVFGEPVAAFEQRWRERTSPGGLDALAMFVGHHWFSLLLAGASLLMLLAFVVRRQVRRRAIAAFDADDDEPGVRGA